MISGQTGAKKSPFKPTANPYGSRPYAWLFVRICEVLRTQFWGGVGCPLQYTLSDSVDWVFDTPDTWRLIWWFARNIIASSRQTCGQSVEQTN